MSLRTMESAEDRPLPDGWDIGTDVDGKVFFIDHNTRTTTWIDPRDRLSKPATFADCLGDELPYGWDVAYDQHIGTYYINHLTHTNQIEDPRLKWREEQERMLKEYLADANEELAARQEIADVKRERLTLANDEYQHLNKTLQAASQFTASKTSLNSAISTQSKYDPDQLRVEVNAAWKRVEQLRYELDHIESEVNCTRQGLRALTMVDEKMSTQHCMYSFGEVQAMVSDMRAMWRSLRVAETEKRDLVQSLVNLRSEIVPHRSEFASCTPGISTTSLPLESVTTASQTDLSGEYNNNSIAEIVRLQLQYTEVKNQIQKLRLELANIDSQIIPGQLLSNRDRLILVQEKEQLLQELRGTSGYGGEQMGVAGNRARQLELDLQQAMESQQLADSDRLQQLSRVRTELLQRLAEATMITTVLETQIKNLSRSTVSMSSGSSIGSLASTGSQGSQGSVATSLSDIYADTCQRMLGQPEIDLKALHRRVERLLKCRDLEMRNDDRLDYAVDASAVESGPPAAACEPVYPVAPHGSSSLPSYEEHLERQRNQKAQVATGCPSDLLDSLQGLNLGSFTTQLIASSSAAWSGSYRAVESAPCGPEAYCNAEPQLPSYPGCSAAASDHLVTLGPVPPGRMSETSSGISGAVGSSAGSGPGSGPGSGAGSGVDSAGGATKLSVSRGISSESVTESDSGVFDANAQRASLQESGEDILCMRIELAQVEAKFSYDKSQQVLSVQISKARNLSALAIPSDSQICIKTTLVCNAGSSEPVSTRLVMNNADCIEFGDVFNFTVPQAHLVSKTLQLYVCSINGSAAVCWGYAMVSLASYTGDEVKSEWYNILSSKFMNMQSSYVPSRREQERNAVKQDGVTRLLEASSVRLSKSVADSTVKEESSDESTVISSQTSTLTRNRGPEDMDRTDGDVDRFDDRVSGSESEEEQDDAQFNMMNAGGGQYMVLGDINPYVDDANQFTYDTGTIRMMCHKETNTDLCRPVATRAGSSQPQHEGGIAMSAGNQSRHDNVHSSSIRRWQTFSPPGVVDEEYVCKLNRSDSDSKVRRHPRGRFERHTADRRNIRVKKPSMSLHHSAVPHEHATRIRTSVDLELDLQAYRIRQAQLNDEITSLREVKRRLEEAKRQGGASLERLMQDVTLQQYLSQLDRSMIPGDQRQKESTVEQLAQQRYARITKNIQRHIRQAQSDETSFRKKMAFFTQPSAGVVPPHVVTSAVGVSPSLLPRQ